MWGCITMLKGHTSQQMARGSFCEQHTVIAAHLSKGFAFIVVLRGMNSTWMNPSLSQNRDAVNFPVDWQAFNFLPLGETGSFRCIPPCLVWGAKWSIRASSSNAADYRNWLRSSLNCIKLVTVISKRRVLCSAIIYLGSKRAPNFPILVILRAKLVCPRFDRQIQ